MPSDEEWDEWANMTEAEQDALLAEAVREHNEWFASLTPDQQYAYCRQRRLEACLRWRGLLRSLDHPVFRNRLRSCQASLATLRAERATGIPEGEA